MTLDAVQKYNGNWSFLIKLLPYSNKIISQISLKQVPCFELVI